MSSTKILRVGDDGILEQVIKKLNYTSMKSFQDDVTSIKKWLESQRHLPEVMGEKKIQNFLTLNKGSVEKTKQRIDNYYSFRTKMPEVFDEINPKLPYLKNLMDTYYFVAADTLSKEMYRVIFIKRLEKTLTEHFDPIEGLRYWINLQEVRLLEDVLFGDIFVIDGTDLPLRAVLNITPAVVYKACVMIYQRVFSSRLKAIYFINCPPFVDKVLLLLKAVMKPKLFQRIHMVTYDALLDHLGKEVTPRDYGGEEKSLKEMQEALLKKFQAYEAYFDNLDKMRVNESLRENKSLSDEMLGIHGNFKKLELD